MIGPAVLPGPETPAPAASMLGSGTAEGWKTLDRILAVRLDSLGDVAMTTPALRALKAQHPGRHLTLLTSPDAAGIGALLDEIEETIAYDAPWMKATGARSTPEPDLAMIHRLAAGGFDGAVIFTVHSQSALPAALLCQLAGIPRRLAHSRENPYGLLTEWVLEPEPDEPIRHEVRRQLDLVQAVGAFPDELHLSLRVPAAATRAMVARLATLGIDPRRPWLLVHPGATASSRRYPPELLAEALGRVRGRTGWPIVVAGGTSDARLVEDVRRLAAVPIASVAGRLDLSELAALVALAPMLLANNSGPAHFAAATGTPVVSLYALTNVQHRPWMVPARVLYHDVPCRGCRRSVCPEGHHQCLRGVEPAEVGDACVDLATELGLPMTAQRSMSAHRLVLAATPGTGPAQNRPPARRDQPPSPAPPTG